MGASTAIAWTDHTFNPWWGCTKVSPGCASCYAETLAHRYRWQVWGKDTARRFFGEKHWAEPYAWDRAAAREGRRARVFCASMADVFEDRPDLVEPRRRLWRLIEDTPNLDWQVLTKRPENFRRLLPVWSDAEMFRRIWLGVSCEDQERADERIPLLLQTPAAVRFVSAEPLLGPVDLTRLRSGDDFAHALRGLRTSALGEADRKPRVKYETNRLDWVIVGGESGPGARPCGLAWVRAIVGQCKAAGVTCFVKQMGENLLVRNDQILDVWPGEAAPEDSYEPDHQGELCRLRLRDRKGGDPDEWPEDLRVQEFPR